MRCDSAKGAPRLFLLCMLLPRRPDLHLTGKIDACGVTALGLELAQHQTFHKIHRSHLREKTTGWGNQPACAPMSKDGMTGHDGPRVLPVFECDLNVDHKAPSRYRCPQNARSSPPQLLE
jgi:hypothetical protein